jgi:Icc-related predicted phosphoesterase
MQVLSDVHFAIDHLRRVVAMGEPMIILGDLVNLIDYRTGEGAVAEVLGLDFARRSGDARGVGDFRGMRRLWEEQMGETDADEMRTAIGDAIAAQYAEVSGALAGGSGFVIHGNVDRPRLLEESLPDGFEYVHGQTREIEGVLFGFVGGGAATPMQAEGEIADETMRSLLEGFGAVDVLCTHVPPAIEALRTDVVTGRAERSSSPVLDYIRARQPALHLFGDVHQPQASVWRIGRTRCRNVGYFRATGRPFELDPGQIG